MALKEEEYYQLLQRLKDTVEGLLISQLSNVWNVYGGLKRLHNAVEKIFTHGCRIFNHDGDPDYLTFIQGLSWLQPSLATELSSNIKKEGLDEHVPQLPPGVIGEASTWLYKSLESHTLSQKLSWLLSDREHLLSCYEKCSFLCQEKYGEAALMCLRAVEQNQSSLLAEIDPSLYLEKWNMKVFHKTHRRCSSLPETQYSSWCGRRQRLLRPKLSEDGSCWEKVASSHQVLKSVTTDDIRPHKNESGINALGLNKLNLCMLSKEIGSDVAMNKSQLWISLPSVFALETCKKSHDSGTIYVESHSLPKSFKFLNYFQQYNQSYDQQSKALCSNLSPSVLEIDYIGLQSDTSLTSDQGRKIITSKLNKNYKAKHMHNSKSLVKNHRISEDTGDGTISVGTKSCDTKDIASISVPGLVNSGSSDTLNLQTKSSDENASIRSRRLKTTVHIGLHETPKSRRPNIRPSELNLSAKTWEPVTTRHTCSSNVISIQAEKRKSSKVGSAPEYDTLRTYKKSFIEDGGSSVLPMAMGFFPRPMEGQSLTSFLSSGQFARPSAELDRENAHFSISEAMIAAIEQVKCNRQLRLAEDVGDDSDEEIQNLKQRIRVRRCQRQREKQRIWGARASLLSDGRTDTTTTDQSVTPTSSSPGTSSDSISTDDVDDLEVDEVKNLSQLKHSGLSMSMASLYSEADLKLPSSRSGGDLGITDSVVSAEGVALSLLRQFSEKQLPRASDLQWLVSEQDAPQRLLPLPKSWPVSPDEAEDSDMREATPLRGTIEWAPPRPQVIFTVHPTPVRRILMAKQNSRCAGCGMKVAPKYAHKYRYCEYLGRYFCTGCHTNQLALIPAKVLTKWDFTRAPVSSFSYRLLEQMMCDPLFRIADLNAGLYRKARQLERTRQLRVQLTFLKDFVLSCRFAQDLQEELSKESPHILSESDVYSMQDLVQVKSGELATRLRELVSTASHHVTQCHLCQARGFVCELCSSREVIYPWQLGKVTRCDTCGACFHIGCWKPVPCKRCVRLNSRRLGRDPG